MFTDKRDALRRLEEALLEEDPLQPIAEPDDTLEDEDLLSEQILDELLEDEHPGEAPLTYQNFSNDYGLADEEYDDYPDDDQAQPRPKKDPFGWVIVICLTLILALGALIFWMLRQGGLL